MTNPSDTRFLKISRFDPTTIRAVYPGMTTLQLEPGPIEGWIQSTPIGMLHINAGSLSRTTLYEGTYTRNMINIGFILNPGSTAIVRGHEYDAGTLAIDVGNIPIHETFPPHMVWAGINCPEAFLRKELNPYRRLLQTIKHLTLTGPRKQLEPLIRLTHHCLNKKGGFRRKEADRISKLFITAICDLLSLRLDETANRLLYAEGDKFLMHMVEVSYQLARKNPRRTIRLSEISKVTGMKSRTLQKFFHEMYGMGPTTYFRVRRLNQVRSTLTKEDPSSTNVSQVARQWGFTHMGRLSINYKRMFGESPSETLARNRQISYT